MCPSVVVYVTVSVSVTNVHACWFEFTTAILRVVHISLRSLHLMQYVRLLLFYSVIFQSCKFQSNKFSYPDYRRESTWRSRDADFPIWDTVISVMYERCLVSDYVSRRLVVVARI